MKLFFDGGSRPEGMEIAVVARGRAFITRDLGTGSGMDAEWLALIAVMRHAHDHDIADPVLLGDALAVIAQANGTVRCPPSCRDHRAAFLALPRPPGRVRIRYLKRTQNLAGIALARLHDR